MRLWFSTRTFNKYSLLTFIIPRRGGVLICLASGEALWGWGSQRDSVTFPSNFLETASSVEDRDVVCGKEFTILV